MCGSILSFFLVSPSLFLSLMPTSRAWILNGLKAYFPFNLNAGFYFIPGALSIEEQSHWIRESLTSFPQPPNRTNHNAIYGPIHDLFIAVQNGRVLSRAHTTVVDSQHELHSSQENLDARRWTFSEECESMPKRDSSNSIAASILLRKLRWSTLGLQFDWSKVSICFPLQLFLVHQ